MYFLLAKISVVMIFKYVLRYGQRDAINTLKQFLIGQFVKFFFLIGQPNASKHL